MRLVSATVVFGLLTCPVFAQKPQPSAAPGFDASKAYSRPLLEELKNLREAALQSDYAWRQLAHLTENIGPRLSGSPQANHAAEYVAGELRRLGLEVRLEEVMVPHWVRGVELAELLEFPGQASGTTQKVVVTALGGSTATPPEGITTEVVVVNSVNELRGLGRDRVAGKIVVYNYPFDRQMAAQGHPGEAYGEAVEYREEGARSAAELGAVAALIRSVGGADYRLPHTGHSRPAGIPSGAVSAEDADLVSHLAQQGRVRMHLTMTPQTLPDTASYNVVADLKGSEHPEQVVIVSGHLDSWDLGTGAIDDGAGVAVAMQAAALLQQLHLRPKRTLRVIAWMNEENGGRGSQGYAETHKAEMANHVAAIESDFGAGHPLGFDVKVAPAALPWLEPVQNVLGSIGANLMQPSRYDVGADIALLAQAGVPTFGLMQDGRTYFNYHHTAADTLDKVAPRELSENAAAMAVLAYALATLPEPLPR
jgi:hypothetical protein